MGTQSLTAGLHPGLLARWRYRLKVPLAFDLDLGGVTFFGYRASGISNNNDAIIFHKEKSMILIFCLLSP